MSRSDKGTKRKRYDNRKRLDKKLFKMFRELLTEELGYDTRSIGVSTNEEELQQAQRARDAQIERRAERRDLIRDGGTHYRRIQRREARIPKDRKCPRCNRICLNSRQWVVGDKRVPGGDVVMCRACFAKTGYKPVIIKKVKRPPLPMNDETGALLDCNGIRLPSDGRCPLCRQLKLRAREWSPIRKRRLPVCRSCRVKAQWQGPYYIERIFIPKLIDALHKLGYYSNQLEDWQRLD